MLTVIIDKLKRLSVFLTIGPVLMFAACFGTNEARQRDEEEKPTIEKISAGDSILLTTAWAMGLFDIQLSQHAASIVQSKAVVELAEKIPAGITDINERFRNYAEEKGIRLSALITNEQNEEILKIDANPDQAYVARIISDHQASIQYFENGMRTANDQRLRNMFEASLNILKQQVRLAQQALKNI